jgi:hypothetical protein
MNKIILAIAVLAVIASAYAACDANKATTCGQDYTSCVGTSTDKDTICTCYGKWGSCLKAADCLTGASYDSFKSACSAAGCEASQCEASSATLVSASFALVAALAAFLF